jgi:hypothetical protein
MRFAFDTLEFKRALVYQHQQHDKRQSETERSQQESQPMIVPYALIESSIGTIRDSGKSLTIP